MKTLLSLLFFLFLSLPVSAQTADTLRTFEGHFFCAEAQVELVLNLYEEDVEVPNFGFLGPMHGYMSGRGIYNTWMLVRHEVKGDEATLRFSNDIGSDAQDVEFRRNADGTYSFHATGGNALRKAVGRKLVKISGDMTFRRK